MPKDTRALREDEREVAEIVHGAHVAWLDRAGVTGAARGTLSLNHPCDDCLALGLLIAGLRYPDGAEPSALEAENDNERFIQITLRERGMCGTLYLNEVGRRVACVTPAREPHSHAPRKASP